MAEREECTGAAAQWCPNCGTCTCPCDHNGERTRDRATCPLHGATSRHAETLCAGNCGEIVAEEGARCDACEVKHLRAERDALHAVLDHALLAHPLPWRVEQDWTWEVIAADGATIAKCMTPSQAQAVVALAEQAAAATAEAMKATEEELNG